MTNAKIRQWLVLGATVVVVLLPVALLGGYVLQKHRWAQEQLAQLEPRHARLLGLEAQVANLDAAGARVEALRAQYLYPSDLDATQAGNAAQQKVRSIFSSAGLQIISSQVLPAKPDKGFDRIPLSVRTESDLIGLQSALAVLSEQTPVLVVNEFEVQGIGGPSGSAPPRLAVSFNLTVLRSQP